MSWLRGLMTVADLAITANNAYQVNKIKGQMRDAEALQFQAAVIEAMKGVYRDYIFQANEIKEDILYYKNKKPIAVAATLLYLEGEISRSGVSADIFDNISDKDYLASSVRSIRHNRMDICEQLSDQQVELAQTVATGMVEKDEIEVLIQSRNHTPTTDDERDMLGELQIKHPGSLEALKQKQEQIVQLLLTVFGHKELIPRLNVDADLEKRIALPSTNVQSPPSVAQIDDGRVACEHCGYRNTKTRTTCKNCRQSVSD